MTVPPGGEEADESWAVGDRDQEQLPFTALLEDSVEDLYENAPCGYLSTLMDGRIAKVNRTLLQWLGYRREELVGHKQFSDLLTIGGKLYHETHFSPLLRMQGEVSGVALELKAADGSRLPALVTSTVKKDGDGEPLLIRTTILDAHDRRAYERELLRARQEADHERERLQRLATTLQRTLIPPALEPVPGLEVAARYHFASADEVGGDFYDLFPLAPGRWGFFMGDVRGKGANAAVVTSLARYTLRAAAVSDPVPATVLANLNTALNREFQEDEPRFCTVIFGLLTSEGRRRGSMSSSREAATPGRAAARRRQCRPRPHARRPTARGRSRRAFHHRHAGAATRRHAAALHRRSDRGAHARPRWTLRRRSTPRLRAEPRPRSGVRSRGGAHRPPRLVR